MADESLLDTTGGMPSWRASDVRAPGPPGPLGPVRFGSVASIVVVLVLGSALVASGRRSISDLTIVFQHAPRHIVPEGHLRQVEIVKRTVPSGSTLLYVMNPAEAWQIGLWQRSLYPDYVILQVDAAALLSPAVRAWSERIGVKYVLAAGSPPPSQGLIDTIDLPRYTIGIPIVLGVLPPK